MAATRPTAPLRALPHLNHDWAGYSFWVLAAAILGFAVPAVFSDLLEMPRNWFLLVYFALVVPFIYGYLRWTGIDLWAAIQRRWIWGVAGGVVLGSFMVMNVTGSQTASPRPEGLELLGSMLWLGVAYGIVDALLLTVLPVSAVWLAFKSAGFTVRFAGRILAATMAFLASLAVTAAYHVGYAEFHDSDLIDPVIGNGLMSLGFLITANPLTAIIAHIVLHIISVWHGIDTTVTLPPHY